MSFFYCSGLLELQGYFIASENVFSMYFIVKGGKASYCILLQRYKFLNPLLAIAFPIATSVRGCAVKFEGLAGTEDGRNLLNKFPRPSFKKN
jgi:hypothetical protein